VEAVMIGAARPANYTTVMPALVAGIHVLLSCRKQGVDGRDKPGHDEATNCRRMREERHEP
jgi:hypothetical protein